MSSDASVPATTGVAAFVAVPDAGESSFDTTEVRWFADGSLPDWLVTWFARGSTSLEIRKDEYRVDGSPDIGVKRRDGGDLEVKLRTARGDSLLLAPGVAGRIEEWSKSAVLDQRAAESAAAGLPYLVDKVVLTRTYARAPDGEVEPVMGRDLSVPGCDVELASVTTGDGRAWTLAFEAWGPAAIRRALLHDTVEAFVTETPLPDELLGLLGPDVGYPEWLATIVDRDPPENRRNATEPVG